jgi:hypothetical protein
MKTLTRALIRAQRSRDRLDTRIAWAAGEPRATITALSDYMRAAVIAASVDRDRGARLAAALVTAVTGVIDQHEAGGRP